MTAVMSVNLYFYQLSWLLVLLRVRTQCWCT